MLDTPCCSLLYFALISSLSREQNLLYLDPSTEQRKRGVGKPHQAHLEAHAEALQHRSAAQREGRAVAELQRILVITCRDLGHIPAKEADIQHFKQLLQDSFLAEKTEA